MSPTVIIAALAYPLLIVLGVLIWSKALREPSNHSQSWERTKQRLDQLSDRDGSLFDPIHDQLYANKGQRNNG